MNKVALLVLGLLVLALAAPAAGSSLKYLGHACFLVTADSGLRIVLDPFRSSDSLRYKTLPVEADVVFISHEHFDHNAAEQVSGYRKVIGPMDGQKTRDRRLQLEKGVLPHREVFAWHDDTEGHPRGPDTIRLLTVDGVRICHLGDLGTLLSKGRVRDIGAVDILLIPVGGKYTIDAAGATKVAEQLNPKIVIPMHYKTPEADIPLAPVDDFLAGKKNVERLKENTLTFSKDNLPRTQKIVVLTP